MSENRTTAEARASSPTGAPSPGLTSWQGGVLALLLGAVCLLAVTGNPLNVLAGGLMIDTDYPNAAAAFEIFVRDAWRWPLGASPNFGGVNIFFSDGAPWFALLAKALHTLTGIFVSLHWLIVVNVLLFAVMARRLAAQVAMTEPVRWLIAALLIFSLIMPVRLIGAQHIALSSYWVVLWAMTCVPMRGETTLAWRRWEFLAAAGIAILSHAYLGAMAITLILVALLFERRWLATVAALAWPALLLYAIGVFQGEHSTTQGAKAYSLDLAVFAESLNWALLPNLYTISEPTQGDIILYLGTGAWALALLALAGTALAVLKGARWRPGWRGALTGRPARRRLVVLLTAATLLALYAMAFDLRVAGQVLWSPDIPGLFAPLYERFRVTGRFGAPLAFMLIVFVALAWGRLRPYLPAALWFGAAGLAVLLQFADLRVAAGKSPPRSWLEDAANQRAAVNSVLAGREWSGRVYKDVGYFELEQQRLIDRLLVDQGAQYFAVVHGARLDPEEVEARSGYARATSGDVVIVNEGAERPDCRATAAIKAFTLCLVE
jgi:hypothetical protein